MTNFNWNEFYRLAVHLNNDHSFDCGEAIQRTIVSRAYYAAFCMAREVLEQKYKIIVPRSVDSHNYVRLEYKKLGRDDINASLRDLRKYRNCCDYNNNVKDLHELAKQSLEIAKEIITNL
jgi:uncharacterized protein (UPF0332 family)